MESDFAWDICIPVLKELSEEWQTPHRNMSEVQRAADFFFVRTVRRGNALGMLFAAGLYSEAASIVRCDFEDWVTYAWTLAEWDNDSWGRVNRTVRRTDAHVYEGFVNLWGEEAAAKHFPEIPPEVQACFGSKGDGLPDLASRARRVGLESAYRIAYPYLSAYSHPTFRPFMELFERGVTGVKANIPRRTAKGETVLAFWALWFETRILTLANRAYGRDVEETSETLLSLLENGVGFKTAVFVREHL